RNSSMDDVPTGQPALALAQKVVERVTAAGLPADLIPATITSVTVSAGVAAENALRSAVLEFMDTVRRTEHAIAADRRGDDVPEELDVAPLADITEEEWRAYWPREAEAEAEAEPDADADAEPVEEPDEAQTEVEGESAETEPAPDRIPEPTPADVPERGPEEVPEPTPTDVPEPSPEDVSTEEVLAEVVSENGSEPEDQPQSVEPQS
ncbi:MAG TPA: hypothetical protein VHI10_13345, partial [Mycobacterium sp.]|nr:hypothetical protein [Mycobacterium sp.]